MLPVFWSNREIIQRNYHFNEVSRTIARSFAKISSWQLTSAVVDIIEVAIFSRTQLTSITKYELLTASTFFPVRYSTATSWHIALYIIATNLVCDSLATLGLSRTYVTRQTWRILCSCSNQKHLDPIKFAGYNSSVSFAHWYHSPGLEQNSAHSCVPWVVKKQAKPLRPKTSRSS